MSANQNLGGRDVRFVHQSLIAAAVGCVLLCGAAPIMAGDSAKGRAADQMKWGFQAAKRGYWLEALDRFEKANNLTPNQARILNNIAVSLEASGRFEEAREAYETALGVAPNDKILRRNFARFKEFYDAQVEFEAKKQTGDEGETKDVQADDTEDDDDA